LKNLQFYPIKPILPIYINRGRKTAAPHGTAAGHTGEESRSKPSAVGGQSGTGNDGEFAHELRIARHRAYPKHGSSRFGTVESDLRTVEHRLRRGEPQVARRYERRGSQRNPAPVAPEITREVHGHRLSGPHIDGGSNEKKQVPGVEKDKRENIQEKAPVIRVIFQVENTEEDDLAKEIADMFLDGRTYYYSGKKPEETKEKTEDTEMEKFVRFEDVQWNLIKTIQV
jgi:hypothetical protein